MTAPRATAAEYIPNALARAWPVKLRWIRLITWGIITAAPTPWTSRNAINCPDD